MAMRPRGGRANIPNRPPRLIVGRVYEQFKPMSEWRQENDYDTLLVYLPGFQKEYIKVTTEDLNIIRVRGERLMADNRWSRFQEDYRVPENCEMRGIRARFDGGILTITMPRKVTNSPPLPPPTATATQAAPKTEEQPFTGAKQEEALPKRKKADKPKTTPLEAKINDPLPPPPPPTTTRTHAAPKTDQEQPKKETKQEEALSNAKKEAKKPDKPQTTPLEAKTLPPQPTPASSSTPTKQEPLKPTPEADDVVHFTIGSLPKAAPKKDKQGVVEKRGTVGEKTDLDKGKGKEALREGETKRDLEASKGKPNDEGGAIGSSFRGGKREENKVGMGRRGMVTMNEDRKALVNVGVGILVIVALGVQVSYTIGLIGKGK